MAHFLLLLLPITKVLFYVNNIMELSLSGAIFHELLKEIKILMENYFYQMVILVKWPDGLKMPWMMLVVAC